MKKIWIFSIVALFFMGCEGFLDTENLTKKDNSNFPKTSGDAETALTGIYALLREMTPGEDGQGFFLTAELLSDDRFGGGGPDDRRMHAVDRLKKVDENMFSDVWKQDYRAIYRSNMLLNSLDGISWESQETRNKIEGQAHFLRAYFYFDLCRLFGTVSLLTTSEPENVPRATAEELYAQIAFDLKTAIEKLPSVKYSAANNSELGRATKWAAEALLARAYLFYTGYYQQESMPLPDNSTLSRTDVITYLDDCINNSGHDLIGDFRNLWPYSNVYTKKDYKYAQDNDLHWIGKMGPMWRLFLLSAIQQRPLGITLGITMRFVFIHLPESRQIWMIFSLWNWLGIGTVNSRLWESWPSKDIRREASILSVEKEMPDYGWGCDKQMNETGYWQKKYMAVNAYNEDGESVNYSRILYPEIDSDYQLNNTQDLVIIRFADVLLMAAELKRDAAPMNRVRARVGLDPVTYSDEALRDERHWELAFEGLRYYDLLRWGIAAEVLSQQNGVKVLDNMVETRMDMGDIAQRLQATKGLMPLPKTQIDLSAGILEQNPGWGNESNMN